VRSPSVSAWSLFPCIAFSRNVSGPWGYTNHVALKRPNLPILGPLLTAVTFLFSMA
jgi:hypothetical protein